jgi:hypothetical protein
MATGQPVAGPREKQPRRHAPAAAAAPSPSPPPRPTARAPRRSPTRHPAPPPRSSRTRQSVGLADAAHALAAAGQHLVDVALVAHIEDDLVVGRVEHIVHSNGQLDHAEAAAQVPAGLGHRVDDVRAQFLAQLLQLLAVEVLQVHRVLDGVEQRRRRAGRLVPRLDVLGADLVPGDQGRLVGILAGGLRRGAGAAARGLLRARRGRGRAAGRGAARWGLGGGVGRGGCGRRVSTMGRSPGRRVRAGSEGAARTAPRLAGLRPASAPRSVGGWGAAARGSALRASQRSARARRRGPARGPPPAGGALKRNRAPSRGRTPSRGPWARA